MEIHFKDIEPIIKETLDMGKMFKISPNGISMMPLIVQGRDSVYIKKPEGRLKKYDIAFFRRPSGEYILHRVVKVKKDSYVMRGDRQFVSEPGVSDENILGVVCRLKINGRTVLPTDLGYRLYVFFRVNTCSLRRLFDFAKHAPTALLRKIKKTIK